MKRNLHIISLIFITTLMSKSVLNAQGQDFEAPNPKFSLYGGYGLSYLNYATDIGKRENGMGLNAGLSYRFNFSQHSMGWSFSIGAEIGMYNSVFSLDSLTTKATYFDEFMNQGEWFDFTSTLVDYKEVQNAMMVQIPLMLQFQTDDFRPAEFYFAIGGRVGIPIKADHKTTVASVKNTGYYPYSHVLFDDIPYRGFGVFTDLSKEGELKFKPAFFLSLETGVRIAMGKAALWLGAYLDYGLNDIGQTSTKDFVEYNWEKPREFIINSVIQSNLEDADPAQIPGQKINPMAIGLKLRISF